LWEFARRSQQFSSHPFALPVVEVGGLDVTVQEVANPQFSTIVRHRGENI